MASSFLLPLLIGICIFVIIMLVVYSASPIFIVIFVIITIILFGFYFSKDTTTLNHLTSAMDQSIIKKKDIDDSKGNTSTNYAYSIWFYVDEWETNYGKEKILIQRGNQGGKNSGQQSVLNPKITLGDTENNINVYIDYNNGNDGGNGNGSGSGNNCEIKNFPLQTWVNLIVSLDTRTLDLYLDGKLVRTCILPGVPKKADGNIIITPNKNGFSGWTSNVKFFSNSLNPQEAYNIYKEGYGSGYSLGNLFDKYKLKFSYLINNVEQGSVEI